MGTTAPASSRQMFTLSEVTELLHLDLASISKWVDGRMLKPIETPGGPRFAKEDVMRILVDIKRVQKTAATMVPRTLDLGEPERHRGVLIAEAALDVNLTVEDVLAAATLTADAASLARLDRAAAGRSAAQAVAKEAAQDVVATRFRADALATRVHDAAQLAAQGERQAAGPWDEAALERAARTAATVEAAAAAVVVETAALADSVARTVAIAAELVESARVTLDRAIEAEVTAAAAGIELRAMVAAHMTAEDVAVRLDRARTS